MPIPKPTPRQLDAAITGKPIPTDEEEEARIAGEKSAYDMTPAPAPKVEEKPKEEPKEEPALATRMVQPEAGSGTHNYRTRATHARKAEEDK